MNVVLFDDIDVVSADGMSRVSLKDHRAAHIQKVLKLQIGSRLRVGKINGLMGVAEIASIEGGNLEFEILELDLDPPPASPIELILALPRPKSLKRCLRAIANLGIKSVHLIHSIRVDKSYWSAPALEPTVLRQSLIDGLEIARDTRLPTVKLHKLFKPFAQDVAPHLVTSEAFVAHPPKGAVSAPESSFSRKSTGLIPVAIGPEGGFSDYEVGLFNEAGFKNLSLGPRIYSVECAIPVIASMARRHPVMGTCASDLPRA